VSRFILSSHRRMSANSGTRNLHIEKKRGKTITWAKQQCLLAVHRTIMLDLCWKKSTHIHTQSMNKWVPSSSSKIRKKVIREKYMFIYVTLKSVNITLIKSVWHLIVSSLSLLEEQQQTAAVNILQTPVNQLLDYST
jgi:hypothetical protein